MDLSQWNNLNPNIVILPSTRKFYGKYPYKLIYHVPGCHILSIVSTYDGLINVCQNDSIYHKRYSDYSLSDLKIFFDLKKSCVPGLRWRSEGSRLAIFSETENELYDIATGPLADQSNRLLSLTRISNAIDQSIIESDKIIVKKHTDYKFKVFIRQGRGTLNDRQNLANYLRSIRQEIKISEKLLDNMSSKYKYVSGCYFYVNDLKIVSMIGLIAPNTIGKVQEVVPINQ